MRLVILGLLPFLAGCSPGSSAPDLGRAADARIAAPSVREGAGLLFTFFDHRAEMRTVERIAQVPASARSEVSVTDPRGRSPGDLVYLADLRKPGKDGQYRSWVDQRGAWLDRVMPRLSQLPRPLLAAADPPPRPKLHKKKRRPRPPKAEPPAPARPRVVLFSTSWCPSCKAAAAHLRGRQVPFLELDVEKNQQAAEQYQKLQTAHGLKAGVVPLILIDGRPLQGFSAPQVDSTLAAAGLVARAP